MKILKYANLIVLVISTLLSTAQDQTTHEVTSYEDQNGNLYWNKEMPVYINLSSKPNEKGLELKSKTHKQYTNPFYFDTEGINYIRSRYAVDKETHKTVYPQTEILFEIYADGLSPVSSITFKGAKKYILDNKAYYGKNLNFEISSKDPGSGVKETYVSINSEPYILYTGPVDVVSDKEHCEIKYYSVDNVGNVEDVKKNIVNIYIDENAPETYHNITGINIEKNIIALNTKLYLDASDKGVGLKKTYYKFDEGEYVPYNGNVIPLKQLDEDHHTLTYYSEDKVGNIEIEKTYKFFLDKSAPILTSDVLGDRFIVNDQIYFSGRTKLKLTAVDNKSGVKEVNYSIDSDEFKKYKDPFYLPQKPGYHIVKYYAVDRLQNETGTGTGQYAKYKYSTKKIYVDLTGPTMSHSFIGERFNTRDTVFVGKSTKIKLSAIDSESGLQYISYAIDGSQEEIIYKEPFTISGNGKHIIEYFGYDNVNNRNISEMHVILDENPPEPNHIFSVEPFKTNDGLYVYPSYVNIYLSGVDQMTGTEKIYYSVNNSIEKLYTVPLKGFKSGKNNLRYKTIDKLGNEKYSELEFYIE